MSSTEGVLTGANDREYLIGVIRDLRILMDCDGLTKFANFTIERMIELRERRFEDMLAEPTVGSPK